jgi:cytochrome c heme-lyase
MESSGSKGGGCPVDHAGVKKEAAPAGCPVKHDAVAAPAEQGGCPVMHKEGKKGQQYNVYAQPIDPTNQMPYNPNQFPAPGQDKPLSTERVKSFIPKGGTENETWSYPSPQMFYNALVRKGKGDDVDIDEVETIVAVHNNMVSLIAILTETDWRENFCETWMWEDRTGPLTDTFCWGLIIE